MLSSEHIHVRLRPTNYTPTPQKPICGGAGDISSDDAFPSLRDENLVKLIAMLGLQPIIIVAG